MSFFDRWRRLPEDETEHDEAMQRLLERARTLPRESEPGRDLWRGIENRIRTDAPQRAESAPSRRPLFGVFPRPVLAATIGLALMLTTTLATLWLAQPSLPKTDSELRLLANELRDPQPIVAHNVDDDEVPATILQADQIAARQVAPVPIDQRELRGRIFLGPGRREITDQELGRRSPPTTSLDAPAPTTPGARLWSGRNDQLSFFARILLCSSFEEISPKRNTSSISQRRTLALGFEGAFPAK